MLAIQSDKRYTSADMKHTLKKTNDTTRLLTISLDADDLAKIKVGTLAHMAQHVKVAGFRPGKVPANIAEKHIDPNQLNNELLEDAVNSAAVKVLEIEGIMPLDRPKVEVQKFVPASLLEFTAELEVIPEIKLGDYKKLKAEKSKSEVTAKDVTEVLENLQRQHATKQVAKRAAKNGDEVTIDFVGTDAAGKEVEGASGQDYKLVLGSKSFIPGFEEGIVGAKAGDKLDLKLTFPKDYHHEPLKGAKVNFAVTVKEVQEVVLSELNDEFAAKVGPFKTLVDLKADIKRELTEQMKRELENKLKDSLVEQLVMASRVPVPEVLVGDQLAGIERDFTQDLMYRGQTLDQFLASKKLTKEEWQAGELRDAAVRRVQVGLALSELSKLEKIEVTQEELEARLKDMLSRYGDTPEIKKQLDTPEARRDLANRVLTEKTVSRLVELNTK
jgi:trigger factor